MDAQKSCRLCSTNCASPLIQAGARALFGRFKVWKNGVLFLFEAPNWDDTFNDDKGYLTYDRETDRSGRFARQLMVEELDLDPRLPSGDELRALSAGGKGREVHHQRRPKETVRLADP